jgi:CDP-2,3-bis-(O-geranylgeranyl)-sn-glycerol synthase
MTAGDLSPLASAAFLVAAFMLAGVCQAAWLASPVSQRFAVPLDCGRTVRGQRVFGDNKTWRGFVMMVPATGASFALLATLLAASPVRLAGLWPLSPGRYALLGLWAGLGFMAGELPNSFLKRQLGIPAGAAARGGVARPVFFLIDHVDSAFGTMLALALVVAVPWRTWMYVAAVGPALHGVFSLLVFQLGGKARAA